MTSFKKTLVAQALALSFLAGLAGSAQATSCYTQSDLRIKFTRKYEDTGLRDDFYNRGGSRSVEVKKFFIHNLEADHQINDVQLLLYDQDKNLLARIARGPDISDAITGANTGAIFNIPWEDTYQLWVEVRWNGHSGYEKFLSNVDQDYAPFRFTDNLNGLGVHYNSDYLQVSPLYSCS
ncbi:hypothetical protein [Pseudoruegeria sp. HB172150]|uniref:hypothetical protein n=1 Tax=Pseudoruegeria sp. HB172150 TaxID=2721164 RepID=UPI0015532137|nr:hypothetical protein [Pseudoruegeria sp. HB172150]